MEPFTGSHAQHRERFSQLAGQIAGDDESERYMALTAVCEALNMATEHTLMGVPPDTLVPPIVGCLRLTYNPDLVYLAARTLTYLVDAVPAAAGVVVRSDGIAALCEKLQDISDIEVAEQAIACLEKLAAERPGQVLAGGAPAALLGFIDFFGIGTQRKAVACVAQACRRCDRSNVAHMAPVLPQLRGLLHYEDPRVVASALTALSRVVVAQRQDTAKVVEAFGDAAPIVVDLLEQRKGDAFAAACAVFSEVACIAPIAEQFIELGAVASLATVLAPQVAPAVSPAPAATPPANIGGMSSPLASFATAPLTPPRHGGPDASPRTPPSAAVASLAAEHTALLMRGLVGLLPPVQDDFLLYFGRGRAVVSVPREAEEDEDEEEEAAPPRDLILSLLRTSNIRLEADERWQECRRGGHTCNLCGKTLKVADWFRSNEQEDFDACCRCMLVTVVPSGRTEAFTDMQALLGEDADAPAAPAPVPQELQPEPCPRRDLMLASPHLLHRLAEALPSLLLLAQETDHPDTKQACLDFLCRVAHALPAEDCEALLPADLPISPLLCSSLSTDPFTLRAAAPALHAARSLLSKNRAALCPVMVREGVLHALRRLQQLAPLTESLPPLPVATVSMEGWKHLLAARAAELVESVGNSQQSAAGTALTAACTALRAKDWPAAVGHLRAALSGADGVSSFELLSSCAIDELAAALSAASPDDAVRWATRLITDLGTAPSAPSPAKSPLALDAPPASALQALCKALVTVVAQLEQLGTKTSRPRADIRLRLVQHKPEAAAAEPEASAGPDAAPAESTPQPSERRRRRRGEDGVQANIEPLATIAAVADFVQSRLLDGRDSPAGQRPEPAGAEQADDDVEDILPPDTDEARQRQQRREARARPPTASVHIRLGPQELPHGLTIAQVLAEYLPDRDKAEAVVLHFSAAPFDGDVKPPASPRRLSFAPVYDTTTTCRAASAVREALHGDLELEGKADVAPLVAALRLLRLLAAVRANVASLALWWRLAGDELTASAVEVAVPMTRDGLLSPRLNNKVLRAVAHPSALSALQDSWMVALAMDAPFLFPPTTRRLLCELAFFGSSRGLARVLDHAADMGRPVERTHRVSRHKMRVWRDRPAECARRVMGLHAASRAMFDFQFYGEHGSGPGPTHEFFTLAGAELQQKGMRLWRDEDAASSDTACVTTPVTGLFLRPGAPSPAQAETAEFAGSFLARAVLDRHVLNLRLAPAMLRVLRGDTLHFDDVRDVDPALFATLAAVRRAGSSGSVKVAGAAPCAVEDLSLTFVLPGADDVPLCPGGEDRPVTSADAAEYCEAVARTLLCDGIAARAGPLCRRFNDVLDRRALRLLELEELGGLFAGHDAPVSVEELVQHTTCDHGFTPQSPAVRMLFEVLAEMPQPQQRGFFRFLTGAPLLPIGGLAALRPRFTVVRKYPTDGGCGETEQLPSVMTCQHFLKLPAYESKEQLRAKLLQAITDGCDAFMFS